MREVLLVVALLAIAAPAAAKSTFGPDPATHHCDAALEEDVRLLRVGPAVIQQTSLVVADGGAVLFVSDPPPGSELRYQADAWTLTWGSIESSGFSVTLGIVSHDCVFTPVSTPYVGHLVGQSHLVVPTMTVPADGSVALQVRDLADPFAGTTTIRFHAPSTLQSSDFLGADPGYPVPGPASILVMALGALAVLGRVWMVRRNGA